MAQLWGLITFALLSVPLCFAQDRLGQLEQRDAARLDQAIQVLLHTPSGKALLKRAQIHWSLPSISDVSYVFKKGVVSRTDAILTRKYNPQTGTETQERQVVVYLRLGSLEDTVLDIAHELVHATSRPAWDPYDPALTPSQYVWLAIEGEGGEVDAVYSECQVAREIKERYGVATPRCDRYLNAGENGFQNPRIKIKQDFYKVGNYKEEILKALGSESIRFPLLTDEKPALFSSTGQAPYPISLIREFREITIAACNNTRKRLAAAPNRSPASDSPIRKTAMQFVANRCQQVTDLEFTPDKK